MTGYFSFQRLITPAIVKIIYVLGFLVLTTGGVALTVWAGLGLNDANIDRQLGWRYVAIGAGALVVGNLIWRVICEFWIVAFNVNHHLASIDQALSLNRPLKVGQVQFVERRAKIARRGSNNRPEVAPTRVVTVPTSERLKIDRPASVLGLS